jgi:hypothetical protein
MSRADSPLRGRVIFAVGARRSGTNWLQRILAAHPDVVAVPSETYLFSHGLRPLSERFHQGGLSSSNVGSVYADRSAVVDGMRDLCDAVFTGLIRGLGPRAERIVERTPDHIRHLDLIGEVYPDAHAVHIIRDGRDVVRSLLSHDWGPSDARDAAIEWRSAIESARAAASAAPTYHEVLYEEMILDPDAHIPKLFDALGLAINERDLDAVLAEARTGYNADPASPAIGAGKWRTELAPEIIAVVEGVAGDVLSSLGYEASGGATPPTAPRAGRPSVATLARRGFKRRPQRSERSMLERAELAQRLLDGVIHAAANDPTEAAGLLAPDALIRIIDGDDRYEARGTPARERFVSALAEDDALRGRQILGYIHPAVGSATLVAEFEAAGRRHPRVFVVDTSGDLIGRVAYYRFAAV